MAQSPLRLLLASLSLLLLAGCAASRADSSAAGDLRVVGPMDVTLRGTFSVDAPAPDSSAQPRTLRGVFLARSQAAALRGPIRQAHYRGALKVMVIDPDEQRVYLDFTTSVDGDSEGSVDDALAAAFARLQDALEVALQSVQAGTPPTPPRDSPDPDADVTAPKSLVRSLLSWQRPR